jgi:hypothetical protein
VDPVCGPFRSLAGEVSSESYVDDRFVVFISFNDGFAGFGGVSGITMLRRLDPFDGRASSLSSPSISTSLSSTSNSESPPEAN